MGREYVLIVSQSKITRSILSVFKLLIFLLSRLHIEVGYLGAFYVPYILILLHNNNAVCLESKCERSNYIPLNKVSKENKRILELEYKLRSI